MDVDTDKLLPALEEGLTTAQKPSESIDRMIESNLSYDRDPDAAPDNTRFWAPLPLPQQEHSINDPIEMGRFTDELPIEQVAERWIVAADPDEVIEQVSPTSRQASTTSSSTALATTRSAS